MRQINESRLLSTVTKTEVIVTRRLRKKVYAFLLRLKKTASGPATYYQKKKEEVVTGMAKPGELIVVQVKNGEFHQTAEHAYNLTAASIVPPTGVQFTSPEFVSAAKAKLLQDNPHLTAADLEEIGYAPSTNEVQVILCPESWGEGEVVKSWGAQPFSSNAHAMVRSEMPDGKGGIKSEAYANLISVLRRSGSTWTARTRSTCPTTRASRPRSWTLASRRKIAICNVNSSCASPKG